jgi:2-oxoglutarate dehydrogenase E2 component (dihydrolipoamide succinyltransferase)
MAIELKVPEVGESITEVQIGVWKAQVGQFVEEDSAVAEVESDKATVEVRTPVSGKLIKILKQTGEKAAIGEIIGLLEEDVAQAQKQAVSRKAAKSAPVAPAAIPPTEAARAGADLMPPTQRPPDDGEVARVTEAPHPTEEAKEEPPRVMPAARELMEELDMEASDIEPTGPGRRILKEDVMRVAKQRETEGPTEELAPESEPAPLAPPPGVQAVEVDFRGERMVPMSPMRRTIAARLIRAQQTAALLTTFNEIDMSSVLELRSRHREEFERLYNVKLGFMSFFVKGCVEGLKRFPQINAQIRGENVVYYDYCDIGIAIGAGKGLVVPVLRNAERRSFSDIEIAIADFAARAKENKIRLEELEGGTFTISNGGVYGSLLSTPIVNPPQSGVLGMHATQDRPVAINGEVVIRPMMYVALTYDHRVVDGREAVSFLRTIKHSLENPGWMLISG